MKALLVAIVLCAVAGLTSFHFGSPADDAALDGVLKPYLVVHVGTASDGILSSVDVDRGEAVSAGQLVAQLNSDVEHATVELAKARAELAAGRQIAGVHYDDAKRRLSRKQALAAEGGVAQEEIEDLRTEVRLAEFALLKADEEARIAELEFERARAALELSTIKSPISGVVIERYLSPGELCSRTGQAEIVSIADLDPLVVEVNAPLEWMRTVRPGTQADVFPLAPGEKARRATVTLVHPIIDTATDTVRFRLELPNPETALPAGLRCNVRFIP